MFCDDMVVMARSPSELRLMIRTISEHCRLWRYSLNIEKTKVMTVGVAFGSEKFDLCGVELEEVKSYKYLGGLVHRNLSDSGHFDYLVGRMKSAVNSVLWIGVRQFSLRTVLVLFNTVIDPTASYGSQMFFPSRSKCSKFDIEMRRFFKSAIGCGKSTHSALFLGELLLLSSYHRFSINLLTYLWHLYNSPPGSLLHKVFNCISLVSVVRSLGPDDRSRRSFMEVAVAKLKFYRCSVDVLRNSTKSQWSSYVKSKVQCVALTEWNKVLGLSTVLSYDYAFVKTCPLVEGYCSADPYAARLIFKLRAGTNALYGSLLRYELVPRPERLCPLCSSAVESSLHFCSQCPALASERNEFKAQIRSLIKGLPSLRLRILASVALFNLNDHDTMRLLLCAPQKLSFSQWAFATDWWSLLEPQVGIISRQFVVRMFRSRCSQMYS